MRANVVRRFAIALGCLLSLCACTRGPAHQQSTEAKSTASDVRPVARDAQPAPAHGEPGAAVETAVVQRGFVPQFVVGYGSVAGGANAKAALGFPEPGRIAKVEVSVGDRVRAGSVLARLDPLPFELQLDEASANLAAARAAQTKARLGVRPQQIAETDAQMRQAKTQLILAQARLDREAKLFSLGVVARADVEAARAAFAGAQGQFDVLQQQRSSEAHPWQPDVEAAAAGVAQAQSAVSAARQKVDAAQLVAPFAGVVVARSHNDGESVDASTPVVEIASDTEPVFTAQFGPGDAVHLHVGDTATIEAQDTSVRVTGEIVAIDPAQGDAHTIAVLIRIRSKAHMAAFGPGAYGKASVRAGVRRGLIVPEAAIVSDAATGSVQVFRKNAEHFDPIPITVEARVRGEAIVEASGLHPGDRVATKGAYELLTPAQASKKDTD